ncbi:Signal recognition particle subunit SRP72 [Aphelenchoides besseyi]|nr:Signal recognition particle subunit SRP72 [Aphelenchoides besseyi]KAI6210212.1 Signal recognition particle subunit SRP72 [Aphelenchoides besseyi]
MAANKQPTQAVRQICTEVVEAEADGDYDAVLKATNKLSKSNPRDLPVQRCKLVALIQLGQFDEALKIIARIPEHQLGNTTVEKAYIFYRQNKNEDALKLLDDLDEENEAGQELKGQLLYRLGRYQEAYQIFRKLCHDLEEDEFEDLRRANLLACVAQLQASGIKQDPTTSELETYEQLFNHACHLANSERFADALKYLERAASKCRETLTSDEYSEKEIDEELASILLEKGYVLQQLGRKDEAVEVYTRLQKQKPSDSTITSTVNFNLQTLKKQMQLEAAARESEAAPVVESSNMSVDELENAEWALYGHKYQKRKDGKGREVVADTEIVTGKLRKRHRKRKQRLPKNYDPNVPPDPERWLPKQERAAYKKKLNKKFKDREVGRGTQGGVSHANAEKIDYSKSAPKEATQSPKPLPTPEGPRQNQQRRQQQKKKKKGGRW